MSSDLGAIHSSLNDLINYNYTATIVDVDISAAYTSTGLTSDGDDWHILYETVVDSNINELVLNSFDTWDDLIDYNYTATIIDVDISAAYSSTGIHAIVSNQPPPPNNVPAPATLLLLILGLAGIGLVKRKRA